MACNNPRCLGNYDFDKIAFFARKRFIEGCQTITLLDQARSQREKEEIVLVSMLDIEDDEVCDLQLQLPAQRPLQGDHLQEQAVENDRRGAGCSLVWTTDRT